MKDLDFVPEGLKINLRRSKTDQFGEGLTKGIPYFENITYCPVTILQKLDNTIYDYNLGLFRRISKRIFKKIDLQTKQ